MNDTETASAATPETTESLPVLPGGDHAAGLAAEPFPEGVVPQAASPQALLAAADVPGWRADRGDVLEYLKSLPDDSVDLVFGSPPYDGKCRRYGTGVDLKGEAWVSWMVEVFEESLRVCRGLVAYVVDGGSRDFRWSCTPSLLMADLHRRGVCLRKPPAYVRNGIPGSGGPDFWKNNYEQIVCATRGGKLPWSNNTACGRPPLFKRSGPFSNRRPNGVRCHSEYVAPKLANPGNVISCKVGGGQMGDKLAHANEAPFPAILAERFVRTFCPPAGVVVDPFSGSGTTGDVAVRFGRRYLGCDVRAEQVMLSRLRIGRVVPLPVGFDPDLDVPPIDEKPARSASKKAAARSPGRTARAAKTPAGSPGRRTPPAGGGASYVGDGLSLADILFDAEPPFAASCGAFALGEEF